MTVIWQAVRAITISLIATASAVTQPAVAQPTTPATPPSASNVPVVVQHNCLLKTVTTCKETGSCTALDNLKGEKLPLKMTVDLSTGIIAGVDRNGWVDATRIASLAQTDDELILQGIDGAVAWQMLVHPKNEAMSFSLATGMGATVGFGTCTAVKEPYTEPRRD